MATKYSGGLPKLHIGGTMDGVEQYLLHPDYVVTGVLHEPATDVKSGVGDPYVEVAWQRDLWRAREVSIRLSFPGFASPVG